MPICGLSVNFILAVHSIPALWKGYCRWLIFGLRCVLVVVIKHRELNQSLQKELARNQHLAERLLETEESVRRDLNLRPRCENREHEDGNHPHPVTLKVVRKETN